MFAKQAANLGLSNMRDISEGGRSQRMADAVNMLLQARAMVRPTSEELSDAGLSRDMFEKTVGRIVKNNRKNKPDDKLDITSSRSSPGLRALGYGLGGGALGALSGNPFVGLAGAGLGGGYGYLAAKRDNRDLLNTAKVLRSYGALTPGALQKSLPLLTDKMGSAKKADAKKDYVAESKDFDDTPKPSFGSRLGAAAGKMVPGNYLPSDWGDRYMALRNENPRTIKALQQLPLAGGFFNLMEGAAEHGQGNMGAAAANYASAPLDFFAPGLLGKAVGHAGRAGMAAAKQQAQQNLRTTGAKILSRQGMKDVAPVTSHLVNDAAVSIGTKPVTEIVVPGAGYLYDERQNSKIEGHNNRAMDKAQSLPSPGRPKQSANPGQAVGSAVGKVLNGTMEKKNSDRLVDVLAQQLAKALTEMA